MQPVDGVLNRLRQRGLKVTTWRRAIVERLAAERGDPDADDVDRRVAASMPDVWRTMVYNTLREPVDFGELIPVEDSGRGGRR